MPRQIALHIDNNYQRRTHVCRNLESLGFELHKASNIEQAHSMLGKSTYRLVLMHCDALGAQSQDLCSEIRSGSRYTIVVALLGSVDTDIEEQLFDRGINDVVTGKQCASRLLCKRIKNHLEYCCKPEKLQNNTIRLKNTIVDFDGKKVWCNGTTRRLPGILADLLKYFIDNPGRVISRQELRDSDIWTESICTPANEGGKTFDVNMSKLRKIIEPEPPKPQIIVSVRGVGWVLQAEIDSQQ